MEIEYLTSLCKLRVDDFNVWFFVLGFQKNTNLQARHHYHLILRMRISQTLPNSMHSFGHCLSINVFKMHRTVCNQHRTDISTSSVIIRRMRTRQCSRLSLVKIKATISHFWWLNNDINRPYFKKSFEIFLSGGMLGFTKAKKRLFLQPFKTRSL